MIQDIYPHVFNNSYKPEIKPSPEDTALNIDSGKILLHGESFANTLLKFPKVKDFPEDTEFTYLFSVDEIRYFLISGALPEDKIPEGYEYKGDRAMRIEGIAPDYEMFAAMTGKHLQDWYRDTCHCGRCGAKTRHSEKERAMVCTECGYTAYPRIMPAVIVGVTNGDRLLLTKYRTGFNNYALIAGFTEIGETLEETVSREVMEEAGIKVKNIRYYKTQPWGTANDILIGYYCDVDGDDSITMDSNELKFAEWVKREDIILQPGSFSLTNEMMKLFKEGKI